jgi:hypothetical protein
MTPNFSNAELACRCGCGALPSRRFMDKVQRLRRLWDRPLTVSSAKRCPAHNQTVSATGPDGPHTKDAIDFVIPAEDVWGFVRLAMSEGFTGIGVHQRGPHAKRFIHLDDLPNEPGQPRPRIWSY